MAVLAITTTGRTDVWIGLGVMVLLVLSAIVALYGQARGYPFFPLLVSAFFLGPFGWVIVLLVVTIAAGPRRR